MNIYGGKKILVSPCLISDLQNKIRLIKFLSTKRKKNDNDKEIEFNFFQYLWYPGAGDYGKLYSDSK